MAHFLDANALFFRGWGLGHGRRFDHFFVTLQAVADGMGFGVGAFPTLSVDLAQGRIVTPFPEWQVQGRTYFVLVPLDSDKPKHLRDFLGWLHAASAESSVPIVEDRRRTAGGVAKIRNARP